MVIVPGQEGEFVEENNNQTNGFKPPKLNRPLNECGFLKNKANEMQNKILYSYNKNEIDENKMTDMRSKIIGGNKPQVFNNIQREAKPPFSPASFLGGNKQNIIINTANRTSLNNDQIVKNKVKDILGI